MADPFEGGTARACDPRASLPFVDRVLDDLRLPDGMFVGRRAMIGEPDTVVIQTGEDGRDRVAAPHRGSLEAFMVAAQAHVSEVYGRPVPRCPLHDHALAGRVRDGEAEWQCPDGDWRCPVGDYEERTWPAAASAGSMAAALCGRLGRRGIKGWRRIGFARRGGRWIAEVDIWPMDATVMGAIEQAAAPIPVEFQPRPGPLPRRVPLRR